VARPSGVGSATLCSVRGRRGLRAGCTLGVVRPDDDVRRQVEFLGRSEDDLGVQQEVDALFLRHCVDEGLDLALELPFETLGLLLQPILHLLELGLPVLDECLPLAGLPHDLLLFLVGGFGRKDAGLLLQVVLQRLDGVVELLELVLLLGALGRHLVRQRVDLRSVALAEKGLARDSLHVDDRDAGGAERLGFRGRGRRLLCADGHGCGCQEQCEEARLSHVFSFDPRKWCPRRT